MVKLIVPLFAFLSLLLHVTAYCQSLSLAAVDSAVTVRNWIPFFTSGKPSGTSLVVAEFCVCRWSKDSCALLKRQSLTSNCCLDGCRSYFQI